MRKLANIFTTPGTTEKTLRSSNQWGGDMHVAAASGTGSAMRPFVSIAMPALNEERYIADAIRSIKPTTDAFDWEIIVLDGGSTDRTRAVVEGLAHREPRIHLVANERRIQAAAVNIAARRADPRAQYLVRADCHATYPQCFVETCVERLLEKRTASIVVPMIASGRGCMQMAIAAAQNSRLGNGGSAHRSGGWSGFVDHGHHAAFDRKAFLELGGYDETFPCNEDAEFDRRLTTSGRRIFLDGAIPVEYFPRDRFRSLARQYFAYGRGRARTVLKHGAWPRLRQIAPVGVLLGCLASLAATPADPRFLSLPFLYVFACLAWGAALALKEARLCIVLSGFAAIVMHMSWGAGFIVELTTSVRRWSARTGPVADQGTAF